MKILTAAQMGEIDRLTGAAGIPGLILMENAGHRVVEAMRERFAPLRSHRVVVLCGKGNNGGDGLVVARLLYVLGLAAELHAVLAYDPIDYKGDAATNFLMLQASGCSWSRQITPPMRNATLVVDAVLGTGVSGAARGAALEMIREINTGFPLARVVAVDIPSGMSSDTGASAGEIARADLTVTFTLPKVGQVLPPNCDAVGDLVIAPIGSPEGLWADPESFWLNLAAPAQFRDLLAPRDRGAHKGTFGHVLVVGGSRGKTGAPAMTAISALRAGAGLVTVACAASALPTIAAHNPEVMTEALEETAEGAIAASAADRVLELAGKTGKPLALGPGLGTSEETVALIRRVVAELELPIVLDADGLNAMAGWKGGFGKAPRVLTPHPGEMARLTGLSVAEVQADRVGIARDFAIRQQVTVILKGQRTVIAWSGGQVFLNPTGSPAMGTGGTGDILTGMIAGMLAQFPDRSQEAVLAAVYLHGKAGELGAARLTEQALIATDLLRFLPEAMDACRTVSH